ncbi:MAG: hypothetical protein WBC68_13570 [Albidovulum sp.]
MADNPPLLTLRLTGPLVLLSSNGAEISGVSRRGQALLVYLANQTGMFAERGYLADLLWSDRSEEQAKASLRQELSLLKRLLPEGLISSDRQKVRLDRTMIATDYSNSGVLLEGFDLRSEGFEEWLRQARSATDDAGVAAAFAAPLRNRPCLAVLPFEELGAKEIDMFADGIVEELTGALSRVHEFHVIARQSAFALRDERLSLPEIAARLGTDYLVEGSVRRVDARVRIAVQLVDGKDGRTLWSERFDDRIDDLFDLQDRIASQVAGRISPSLRAAEIARADIRPPESRSAYELVLSALPHFWSHQKDGNARALALFNAALVQDPNYGVALAMKAWCHAHQCSYIWTDSPAEERRLAIGAADLAAAAAGDHAPTLVAVGAAISLTSLDRDRAQGYIDRALAIDPNNAWGWLRNGWLNTLTNRAELALEYFARAEALSPLDPFRFNIEFGKANAMAELGEFDAAVDHMRAGLSMAPGISWAYRMLASYLGNAGRKAEACEAMDIFLTHYPGMTITKMRESMPPAIFEMQPVYVNGLRKAGIPEN